MRWESPGGCGLTHTFIYFHVSLDKKKSVFHLIGVLIASRQFLCVAQAVLELTRLDLELRDPPAGKHAL